MATLTTSSANRGTSYVEWSPVIAGAMLAGAVSIVLLQFGSGLGLSVTRLYERTTITWAHTLTVGLWLLWVQIMASMSGAYLAGRLRAPWDATAHESEIRDGAHGLLVWATSSVFAVIGIALAAFLTAIVAMHVDVTDKEVHISADMARKAGIVMGFSLLGSSVVSAVAAWGMGVLGGDHRDRSVDSTRFISFRKK